MSYILDALRRADAERERGHVPGIHAQPAIGAGTSPRPTPARSASPWMIGAALALVLVLALGWLVLRESAPRRAVETPPAPAAVAPAAVAPVPVASVAVAPAAPLAASVAAAAPAPATAAKDEPLPVIRQTRRAAPAPAPASVPMTHAGPAPAGAASAGTGEARVYTPAELPDEIRRQLPAISIGGSAYSKKAADRILIVNGQVLHEGDKVAPDLVLLQIKLRAAVLAFRGYRYEISY